ncbi:MAG TPA: TVP38/TMEM64 family protein [Thermomicrobiales bacterium]|nr:TVP38/TMEM64 family protein [Thermomicrobiales bacterium]
MIQRRIDVNADKLRWIQLGLALGLIAVLGLAYWSVAPFQAEVNHALAVAKSGDLEELKLYIQSYGNWAPLASLGLMVGQALAAPVPSFTITFANGLVYGVFWGWLLSVAGHALAATVCFYLARSLGRRPVETLTGKVGLEAVDGWIQRRGAMAVLVTRLVPGISFDVVSYAVGLTGMSYGRFLLATVLGTLPQTLLYAYLGQNAPQYAWMLLLASGLTIASTVTVSLVRWRRRTAAARLRASRAALAAIGPPLRPMTIEQATGGD